MKMALREYLGSFKSLNKDTDFQLLRNILESDVKPLRRRQRSLLKFWGYGFLRDEYVENIK
jgi:transposase-like protein